MLIAITNTEAALQVDVVDDGVGGANPAAGSGLRGLCDRAEALGGWITITSAASHGTHLTAQLPLPN